MQHSCLQLHSNRQTETCAVVRVSESLNLCCSCGTVHANTAQLNVLLPEEALISSPRQTRLGQRLILMQLLARPEHEASEQDLRGCCVLDSIGAKAASPAHVRTSAEEIQKTPQSALCTANQVQENPTLATQLVIGCYAALHKAKGMVRQRLRECLMLVLVTWQLLTLTTSYLLF